MSSIAKLRAAGSSVELSAGKLNISFKQVTLF